MKWENIPFLFGTPSHFCFYQCDLWILILFNRL